MEVVQIGDVTTGKKCWVSHFIRLPYFWNRKQKPKSPLCYAANRSKIVNADGFGDYFNGLKPTYAERKLRKLMSWSTTEPLLSTAIGKITGTGKMLKQSPEKELTILQMLSL
jgi:hypothetical protein